MAVTSNRPAAIALALIAGHGLAVEPASAATPADAPSALVDQEHAWKPRRRHDARDADKGCQLAYETPNVVSDAWPGKLQEDDGAALFHLNLHQTGNSAPV